MSPEFEIILKCFSFTGVIFLFEKTTGERKTKLFEKIKPFLTVLTEIAFILLTVNTVRTSITSGVEYKTTFKVTTITINVILLLLRMALLKQKAAVLMTLSKLDAFRSEQQNSIRKFLRNYSALACCCCFLFPLVLIIGTTTEILLNTDRYFSGDRISTCSPKMYCVIFIAFHSFIYLMHFLAFPGLVMTLLTIIYLSFVKTFRQHLGSMRYRLLESFSREEISKALAVFALAKKIHRGIERSVQLFSFLSYVLIFSNFLQLISSIVTSYMSDKIFIQIMYTYITLGWTILWFISLTMCGSQIGKIEIFIKNMSQDIIAKNFGDEEEEHKKLVYINLFNTCADINLRFTGWEMFVVDKKLLLTITGILVTYGVLFATEVSKMTN
ncbi:uncharacterized protein NPIL_267151 [Nephila pilipes]|uniref:Gustatory receptor n=1 Tax=Nephila pilipes TaxID=299642 RepID=A0A8X6PVT3_NEPPI|nr:uncharacterized protein NPIL_267151 [Nephila pilipes]